MQAVQDALQELSIQLEQQQQALENQRRAEESVKRSEIEQRGAVEEVRKQEEAYFGQIKSLERKKDDPSAGQVSKSKAAAGMIIYHL